MNPYIRIALGTALAQYVTPAVLNKLAVPEINPGDELRNNLTGAVVVGTISAAIYIALGVAFKE